MFSLTLIACILLVCIPLYGLRGGSCTLFFTGLLVTLFGLLVKALQPMLSSMTGGDTYYIGLTQLIIFLPLCGVAFPLGAFIHRFFLITFDPFDWVIGFLAGIVTAVISLHFLLGFTITLCKASPKAHELKQTFVVQQLVYFDGWHKISHYFATVGSTDQPIQAPED